MRPTSTEVSSHCRSSGPQMCNSRGLVRAVLCLTERADQAMRNVWKGFWRAFNEPNGHPTVPRPRVLVIGSQALLYLLSTDHSARRFSCFRWAFTFGNGFAILSVTGGEVQRACCQHTAPVLRRCGTCTGRERKEERKEKNKEEAEKSARREMKTARGGGGERERERESAKGGGP